LVNDIAIKEKYDEMLNLIKEDLQDTFGRLGKAAIDSVWDSIKNGTDAWGAFKRAGMEALETLGQKLMYTLYFSKAFDKLQKDLEDIATNTNLTDEQSANKQAELLAKFYKEIAPDLLKNAQEFGDNWIKMMKEQGFDVEAERRKAQVGGFAAASQDSVNELSARFALMNQLQAESVNGQKVLISNSNAILAEVTIIKGHTQRLEKIENTMIKMGNNIDTINSIGVRIRN